MHTQHHLLTANQEDSCLYHVKWDDRPNRVAILHRCPSCANKADIVIFILYNDLLRLRFSALLPMQPMCFSSSFIGGCSNALPREDFGDGDWPAFLMGFQGGADDC